MTVFEKNISALQFNFKKETSEGGIILTNNFLKKAAPLSPQELFALETANTFKADAVYFRYFDDGRESVPQIYIFDNTDDHLTGQDIAEIHRRIWSGCYIPLFLIVEKTNVRIFDAREKVKEFAGSITTDPFETIKLAGNVFKQFSALQFETGLYWEEKNHEKRFQFATSAYKDLIDGLKRVYTDFQNESGLDSHVALKLLVQCLLIKYLEERDEESKSGYFAKSFFRNHFGASDFCDVIEKGKLLDLLDKLSATFNGKIFEWNAQSEKAARDSIQKVKVKKLARYLDGNSINQQYVLWRLYSFSYLPVELISSVYEELLGKGKKDTIYTPDVVASTLVDECMPLRSPKSDFKIIDVSCGSGIFLVKSFKRIIQWWRYERWKQTGKLEKPDLETLKLLLSKSIYGIDIQGDAVRLSIFSLALALLDELDPKTIWTKLRFEDLGERNILSQDFFKFITNNPPTDFDLVLGNPPFNPPGNINNGAYYKSLQKKYDYRSRIKIPDYNLALIFLTEAITLLKPKGLLCLIQPSGPLMYQEDKELKEALFNNYNLLQVIDFTKLGDVLWGKANVATAAIFLQNSLPTDDPIVHIIANRTPANLKKLFLELDHYDFHTITKESALNNYVWKSNLLGGGRITDLLQRLIKIRKFGDFLFEKEENHAWQVGEGFKEKGKDPKPSDYITGQPYLPSDAFDENGINKNKIRKCKTRLFYRAGDESIYQPPHLLIKENIGAEKLSIALVDEYLVFSANIIGIHAPKRDRPELKEIFNYFQENNDLLRFFIKATSSQLSISKATVPLKEDFMNLPYPERKSELTISSVDKILVKEVLNFHLGPQKKQLADLCDESQLKAFSKIFCKTLNSVYETNNKTFHLHKILDAGNYFALHFVYEKNNSSPALETTHDLEHYIQQFIPTQKKKGGSYHIQRVLKIFSRDNIILTKPKNLRYWLLSIALRDADETFADYIKAGY